jgi:hypothetical protein
VTALLVIIAVVLVSATITCCVRYLGWLDDESSTRRSSVRPEAIFRAERYADHLRHRVATARTADELIALSVRRRAMPDRRDGLDAETGR